MLIFATLCASSVLALVISPALPLDIPKHHHITKPKTSNMEKPKHHSLPAPHSCPKAKLITSHYAQKYYGKSQKFRKMFHGEPGRTLDGGSSIFQWNESPSIITNMPFSLPLSVNLSCTDNSYLYRVSLMCYAANPWEIRVIHSGAVSGRQLEIINAEFFVPSWTSQFCSSAYFKLNVFSDEGNFSLDSKRFEIQNPEAGTIYSKKLETVEDVVFIENGERDGNIVSLFMKFDENWNQQFFGQLFKISREFSWENGEFEASEEFKVEN